MKKLAKRSAALLFVMILSSILVIPTQAYWRWKLQVDDTGKGKYRSESGMIAVSSSWKKVDFRLKGDGIDKATYDTWNWDDKDPCPIEVRNFSVCWERAKDGYCYGSIEIRSSDGSTGGVTLYLKGSGKSDSVRTIYVG
ncbi:MAG: hypothetical protein IKN96_04270 [Oscillibacter sp.]|nr:hypothetical protein [Oscillibacter sp.]